MSDAGSPGGPPRLKTLAKWAGRPLPLRVTTALTGVAANRGGLCPVTVRFGLNLLVLFLQHRALARGRRLVDQIGGKVLFGLMYQSQPSLGHPCPKNCRCPADVPERSYLC